MGRRTPLGYKLGGSHPLTKEDVAGEQPFATRNSQCWDYLQIVLCKADKQSLRRNYFNTNVIENHPNAPANN